MKKRRKKLLSIGKRALSSLLCTVLLLGSIVAADVFYNFTGQTAFASTTVRNDVIDDARYDSDDGYYYYDRDIRSMRYEQEKLNGKVFRSYKAEYIDVSKCFEGLQFETYSSDDNKWNWLNISKGQSAINIKNYNNNKWTSVQIDLLKIAFSNNLANGVRTYGLPDNVKDNGIICLPFYTPQKVGSYSYTLSGLETSPVASQNTSTPALSFKLDTYVTSPISSGTFYVDQETGIKVISGNPSWLPRDYT